MTTTPQLADIASFETHGMDFWDKKGAYRTLHEINPARLKFIERYINPRGQKILDIGCGGGILSESLADKGAQVFGIDLSASVLAAAKAHRGTKNIDYRLISSQECVAAKEKYDHIVCMEMLEHVANPAAILRDISALLKPNGYAFFSTINRTIKAKLGAIVAAEYLLKLVPKGTHQYDWFIRPDELVRTAEHAGLTPVALCGMDYHPLLKTATLSRNIDINYLFVAQKSVQSQEEEK